MQRGALGTASPVAALSGTSPAEVLTPRMHRRELSSNMQGFNPPLDEYPPPKEGEPALHRAARIGDCA